MALQVVKTIHEFRQLWQECTGLVGFVPTMGYLHEGHLSLVRRAKVDNSIVVVSIFVNPSQFSPAEDLRNYPRDISRDLELLSKEKTDIVFIPSDEEMYPADFSTWVDVGGITEKLEGVCRLGHFRGVATVVIKLFNIVRPARAYFGQKDAQQALVIKRMVANLNMDIQIVVVPTVRESDGLAMSSRNIYLNSEERHAATVLFEALSLARELCHDGENDADRIRQQMTLLIQKEPLAQIEYISIADAETLEETKIIDRHVLASLAVKIGKIRLIDNSLLE